MQDIVSVVDLVKRYGNMIALDHFTMEIERGEIFGLLGPNGSGKTTAINCILQLLTYDRGEIRLFGQPMTQSSYDLPRLALACVVGAAVYAVCIIASGEGREEVQAVLRRIRK